MNDLDHVLEEELDIFDTPKLEVKPEEADEEGHIQPEIKEEEDFFKESAKEPEDDLISDLLKTKGINGSKLTMLNEQEEEMEVDFFELTKEEQLEILSAQEVPKETEKVLEGLANNEREFIDYLRKEKISLDDYLTKYKEQTLSEVTAEESTYDIDAYSDEELFLLDLKSRYEDLSDDELKGELDRALEDKELFTKKITKTREEYKNLETAYAEETVKVEEKEREEQYGQFVDNMVDVAVNTPEFYGIELEDDEKNEVLSYLLELDDKGASEFSRAINDPKKLYEAAWFLKYGKEAFEAVRNAYNLEAKKLKDNTPEKKETKEESKVVVKKSPDEQAKVKSIYDLNF